MIQIQTCVQAVRFCHVESALAIFFLPYYAGLRPALPARADTPIVESLQPTTGLLFRLAQQPLKSTELSFCRSRFQDRTAQAAQLAAVFVSEPTKAGAHGSINLRLHSSEQLQPLGCDAGDGLALFVVSTKPFHQAAGLQTVHQTNDIGSAVDHAPGDLATRVAFGMDTSQDAQHVVLRARNAVHFAELVH